MNSLLKKKIAAFAFGAAASIAVLFAFGHAARASESQLVAKVSISQQRMVVALDGRTVFHWKVSTARRGYETPTGAYKPTRMYEMWHSRQYDNAPMAHSVFFHQGVAVHAAAGAHELQSLGHPASHGCVRLAPTAASDFYELVQLVGAQNTSIVVVE